MAECMVLLTNLITAKTCFLFVFLSKVKQNKWSTFKSMNHILEWQETTSVTDNNPENI